MAIINNQELKKAFSNSTKTQLLEQPNQVDNSKVIPIIDVTPLKYKVCDIILTQSAINSTGTTIYTTPTGKDFYLTAVSLSMLKDATATSTGSYITITVNGLSQTLARIIGLTLTAQSGNIHVALPTPIKIDRGTIITVNNTTATGNVSAIATIFGYTDEVM